MTNGAAPYAAPLDSVGGREKLRSIISKESPMPERYDLDNLSILTPKAHIELHKKT